MTNLKKPNLLPLLFCCIPLFSNGQNLIQNGGFEDFSHVPNAISQIHLADHWSPVSVTADLFCAPSISNIPAHRGHCYAGFGLWVSNTPYITTESFTQKLQTPLVTGTTYYMKFYASSADWSLAHCANIEVHGTVSVPNKLNDQLNYVGDFTLSNVLGVSPVIMGENWRLIEMCFVAPRDIKHITISTSNSNCDQYFYIDDIELYELETHKFFEDEASLCKEEPLVLGTQVSNATFEWQDGSTAPTLIVTEPGWYWWTVDTVCGLVLSDTILVKDGRIELEDHFLGEDSTLCQEEDMILEVQTDDSQLTFEWNNGENDAQLVVTEPGIYQVEVHKEDCTTTDEVEINYVTCEDCVVNAPNIFSPNNDGINDLFRAYSNCPMLNYSMKIFDRWGALVFSSQRIEEAWDGQDKKNFNAGIFVYTIEYEAEQYGEIVSGITTGEVTIIR